MDWKVVELAAADQRVRRYQLTAGGDLMTRREVVDAWSASAAFVDFYSGILADCPFEEFRWETPPLVATGLDDVFEFVLAQSRGLDRRADPSSFDAHFDPAHTVVQFGNLGGDCVLVVPCPATGSDDFAHFGAFLRSASAGQIRALWHAIPIALFDELGDEPIWLSTAGAGVPWLHIRLDQRPKYYAYGPYRDG